MNVAKFIAPLMICYFILQGFVLAPMAQGCVLSEEEANELVKEAFTYGFPLVLGDVTGDVTTNVVAPTPPGFHEPRAPVNQISNFTVFPDASFVDIVNPNTDTLYSSSYMDLTDEPMILSVPAMDDSPTGVGKRYYVIPFYDPWTHEYASIGSRTTGTEAQVFAICPRFWRGCLPDGVTRINSPYKTTWFIGRIYCQGGDDVAKVNALQEQLDLRPLSEYGNPSYTPPAGIIDPSVNMYIPPSYQVMMMDAITFFTRFAELMKTNLPKPRDYEMVGKLLRMGIIPGLDFDMNRLNPTVAQMLDAGVAEAKTGIQTYFQKPENVMRVNGWYTELDAGEWGTDYALRAAFNLPGFGAVIAEDAVYPGAYTDSMGNPLINLYSYVVHFEPGQLPPCNENAFWSLTVSNQNYFLVDEKNLPVEPATYTIHSSDIDASHFNPDGSLDIYLTSIVNAGRVPQGKKWLVTPTPGNEQFQPVGSQGLPDTPYVAPFSLVMRVYWPDADILNGVWTPPVIQMF